jgi:hypothetical protein
VITWDHWTISEHFTQIPHPQEEGEAEEEEDDEEGEFEG